MIERLYLISAPLLWFAAGVRCCGLLLLQVPDSDCDEYGLLTVRGKSVRALPLSLELSISQITGAARPALGCKVSPRLAQRGCELVVTLVREVGNETDG